MNINTLGKFQMFGEYKIIDGKYLFKYGSLFDKKFDVKEGGTVNWNGDPFGAVLNLEAVYKTQANPGIIIENPSLNQKVPTELVIAITGNLKQPESDFQINFPTISSVFKNEIDADLQNKDKRQQQAFALLGTGNFYSEQNLAIYGSLIEKASSLFGEVVSDGENKINLIFDYQTGDRSREQADRAVINLTTNVTDKIKINGNVGVPVGGINQSYIVGNVEVELILNAEGTLTARVFNKENDINLAGFGQQIGYTQGIGLSYNVDFDDFKELLQKLFKSQKKKTNTDSNSDQTPDSDINPEFLNFIEETKRRQQKQEPKKEEEERVPEIED
jgi:hypothetical protein